MTQYDTPGVYIEERTGPGVIAGVGTSTAAFIGPTLRGPLNEPRRITSFDDFLRLYGGTRDNKPWPYLFVGSQPYYVAFAVEGFFANGGSQAFVVRVGNGDRAIFSVPNRATSPQDAFIVRAVAEGTLGNSLEVATEEVALATAYAVAQASVDITVVDGATCTLSAATNFRVGDFVTTDGTNRGRIMSITGAKVSLDSTLAGAAVGDHLRIADLRPDQAEVRLTSIAGLRVGDRLTLNGQSTGTGNPAVSEAAEVGAVDATTSVVTLSASPTRLATIRTDAAASPAPVMRHGYVVGRAGATVQSAAGERLTVDSSTAFQAGDTVTIDGTAQSNRARVLRLQGNEVTLAQTLTGAVANATLRIADLTPDQQTLRVAQSRGLYPGGVVQIVTNAAAPTDFAVVESVSGDGLVTLAAEPVRTNTFALAAGSQPVRLVPREFRLVVNPNGGPRREEYGNLSLNPRHPRYLFNPGVVTSSSVTVEMPDRPPTETGYPARLAAITSSPLAGGATDNPGALTSTEYQAALNALRRIDDVNIVCVPDASSHNERRTIQTAVLDHCVSLADRVAVLDPIMGAPPFGPGSVEQHRGDVQSERGFGALYYPWLTVRDPRVPALQMSIPPSGHVAGVFARVDEQRGVHKAPANAPVRGILGLERRLTDEEQGPLNLLGVNALRIFQGSAQVMINGARTTVDPTITDWVYLSTRRLMCYIEESIAEGIRWAVFEPNNLSLWKKLDRTLRDFLRRVQRDGALYGTDDKPGFYIRIDEGLNPPSTQAMGRLYIEIGVRPAYPAEFIIVGIGLWDGGTEISE